MCIALLLIKTRPRNDILCSHNCCIVLVKSVLRYHWTFLRNDFKCYVAVYAHLAYFQTFNWVRLFLTARIRAWYWESCWGIPDDVYTVISGALGSIYKEWRRERVWASAYAKTVNGSRKKPGILGSWTLGPALIFSPAVCIRPCMFCRWYIIILRWYILKINWYVSYLIFGHGYWVMLV